MIFFLSILLAGNSAIKHIPCFFHFFSLWSLLFKKSRVLFEISLRFIILITEVLSKLCAIVFSSVFAFCFVLFFFGSKFSF